MKAHDGRSTWTVLLAAIALATTMVLAASAHAQDKTTGPRVPATGSPPRPRGKS
jgi:hypothetical protein